LLELILSLAIIGFIVGIGIPIFTSFQQRSDIDVAINSTAQRLRRAQVLAQSMKGDSAWGVTIKDGQVIVFKGPNYSGRDQDYDETVELSDFVNISGITEVIYSKYTGEPDTTGTITFTSDDSQQRFITINDEGMVAYD